MLQELLRNNRAVYGNAPDRVNGASGVDTRGLQQLYSPQLVLWPHWNIHDADTATGGLGEAGHVGRLSSLPWFGHAGLLQQVTSSVCGVVRPGGRACSRVRKAYEGSETQVCQLGWHMFCSGGVYLHTLILAGTCIPQVACICPYAVCMLLQVLHCAHHLFMASHPQRVDGGS